MVVCLAGFEGEVLKSSMLALARHSIDLIVMPISATAWDHSGLDRKSGILPAFLAAVNAGYDVYELTVASRSDQDGLNGANIPSGKIAYTRLQLDKPALSKLIVEGSFEEKLLAMVLRL